MNLTSNNVLALIPARGGSKSIPRKNLIKILGKPLIAWTIELAKKSKFINRVIVSTDDEENEKVTEPVDDSQLKDNDYYWFKTENFKGILKQMDFYEGEEFDVELITITVNREEGENVCRFEYDGEELDGHELNGGGSELEIRPL